MSQTSRLDTESEDVMDVLKLRRICTACAMSEFILKVGAGMIFKVRHIIAPVGLISCECTYSKCGMLNAR